MTNRHEHRRDNTERCTHINAHTCVIPSKGAVFYRRFFRRRKAIRDLVEVMCWGVFWRVITCVWCICLVFHVFDNVRGVLTWHYVCLMYLPCVWCICRVFDVFEIVIGVWPWTHMCLMCFSVCLMCLTLIQASGRGITCVWCICRVFHVFCSVTGRSIACVSCVCDCYRR